VLELNLLSLLRVIGAYSTPWICRWKL